MVSLKQIDLAFGNLQLFNNLNLSIARQEFTCLFGPSGVGKSSILNLLAGLIKPNAGEVKMEENRIGYVFQDTRLLPWCTVKENIEISLWALKLSPRQINQKVDELINRLNLGEFAYYYPNQLSGGMKQRVSLGRAFVIEPNLLLMDEPFAALDEKLKIEMHNLLLELIQWNNCTTVFVTHDLEEAIKLADKIVLMRGRPCEIKDLININHELRHQREYIENLRSLLVS